MLRDNIINSIEQLLKNVRIIFLVKYIGLEVDPPKLYTIDPIYIYIAYYVRYY